MHEWRDLDMECPVCKSDFMEVKTDLSTPDGFVLDGDNCRCKRCGFSSLVEVNAEGEVKIRGEVEIRNEIGRRLSEAEKLIIRGVEIMTPEQLGKWEGVRAWLEGV